MKIEIKNSDLTFHSILLGIIIISLYLIMFNLNDESIIMLGGYCSNVDGNNVTIDYATYFFVNYFDDDIMLDKDVKITARRYVGNLLFIENLEFEGKLMGNQE